MKRGFRAFLLLPAALALLVPLSRAQNAGAQNEQRPDAGQEIFISRCAACHGLDGKGGEHAPNIAANQRVQQLSDFEILHIVSNGIPGAGMPGFRSSLDQTQLHQVVAHLRVLQGNGARERTKGDTAKGHALFFGKAQCSECHMVDGQGGFIASDLSGYGTSHSSGQIREAIVNPNKNLNPKNRVVVVTARDGRVYRGIARNEDNFSLQLQVQDATLYLFEKSDVRHIEHEPRSLMPADYDSALSSAELDDLVSYLAHLQNAKLSGKAGEEEDF